MNKICHVLGCKRPAKRRGLCWSHEFADRYKTRPKFRENRNKTRRTYSKRLLQRYRDRIAGVLGGWKCRTCGMEDRSVLVFDHKNGDGEDERDRMGGQIVTIRYYAHHLEEAGEKLQVLCANCNWKRNAAEKYGYGSSRTAVWMRQARKNLIDGLGGSKCTQCGITDIDVLTLDHLHGGGSRERKSLGGYDPLLRYYSSHPGAARENLQVLCRNCNWRRHLARLGH